MNTLLCTNTDAEANPPACLRRSDNRTIVDILRVVFHLVVFQHCTLSFLQNNPCIADRMSVIRAFMLCTKGSYDLQRLHQGDAAQEVLS